MHSCHDHFFLSTIILFCFFIFYFLFSLLYTCFVLNFLMFFNNKNNNSSNNNNHDKNPFKKERNKSIDPSAGNIRMCMLRSSLLFSFLSSSHSPFFFFLYYRHVSLIAENGRRHTLSVP